MSQTDLLELLNKVQTDFYTNNGGKNILFKNNQKQKCTESITNQFNLYDLLKSTVYIIPNTNKIYLNYLLFKTFANNSNNNEIIDYIIELLCQCINTYGQYEMHINLHSFSISAAERYKSSIQLFCEKCYSLNNTCNVNFAGMLIHMYIYNTPSVISTITQLFKPFIDPLLNQKLIFITKDQSPLLLEQLLV